MCNSMTKKQFETKLNEIYNGSVVPLTSYVNDRAVQVYKCSKCHITFFGKPSHMVGQEHQQHECNKPYGDSNGERLTKVGFSRKAKSKGKVTIDQFYDMVWNDYTWQEIAKKLQINPNIVKEYFITEGLI